MGGCAKDVRAVKAFETGKEERLLLSLSVALSAHLFACMVCALLSAPSLSC